MTNRLAAALLAATLCPLACTDLSRLPDAGVDAGPRSDGWRDAWRGEGPPPDLPGGPCDPTCVAEDLSLCLKLPPGSSDPGRCVECLDDSHCRANPGALGNRCDKERHFCICESDGECAGNGRGPHCDLANQMCVCTGDAECKPPLPLCVGTEVKTCRPACRADKDCGSYPKCDLATGRCLACTTELDCQKNLFNKHCELASGRCLACTENAHCPPGAPFCSAGSCVECKQSSDCAQSPKGSVCSAGRCGCTASASCQAPSSWGAACRTQLAAWRCGCAGPSDCAGKLLGPRCDAVFHWCTCASDAECTASPATTCIFPSDSAEYRQCQPPCGGDAECQQRTFAGVNAGLKHCLGGRCVVCGSDLDCASDLTHPHCDATGGRCVACTADKHCGGLTPICDAAAGRCVECKAAADCLTHPNGPLCKNGRCGCGGDPDCLGPPAWGKSCLTVGQDKRCGCNGDQQCTGQVPGPHCTTTSYKKCSCLSDAECSLMPGYVCALPYANASYRYCQKPCSSAADCAGIAGLPKCSPGGKCAACLGDGECSGARPFCNTEIGQCVGCKAAADCAKEEWAKLCDPLSGCAECLADGDCTATSLGKVCSAGSCVCATAADCATNLNGKLCDPALRACGCLSDADCPAPRKCVGSFFSAKICK